MGFLNMNLGDVKEQNCAPEGEYDLVIENVKRYTKEDTKNEVIRIGLTIQQHDDSGDQYKPVYHYLSFPGPEDDDDKAKTKMRMIKRFLTLSGVPFQADGFAEEDLYGCAFRCNLGVEHNEQTGEDNNRLNVPRMKD